MTFVKPKIKLTENEVDAIKSVIDLCCDLSNINGSFLSIIFENDYADEDFLQVIDTLKIILNNCEY